jgi:ABC-type phosphate/phosphonate transport system permease subunit
MSTNPPAPPEAPDPETITDTSTQVLAQRAAAVVASAGFAAAIAERDQFEDARKAQFLGFRRWLVPSLFALTVAWLVFVGCIVLREELQHGKLSDTVLIALLGTATANVLGLLIIVLKSIFPLDVDREGE